MTTPPQSNPQTSPRLFFAVELSNRVREDLADLSSRMEKAARFTPAKISWVPAENFHLTLYFMGNLPRQIAESLKVEVPPLIGGLPSFDLDVRKLGMFPSDPKTPPRVLWIGIHKPPAELFLLRDRCADALRKCGLPVPDQDFHPHVTLARIKSTKGLGPFRKQIQLHDFHKSGKTEVERLVLMESITGDGPARYQPWATFPLSPREAPEKGDDKVPS